VEVDAKKALTQSNKDGDVEDRVGGQLMELNPVNKKKSTKEFVDWNR
jgi:hypothetical protein